MVEKCYSCDKEGHWKKHKVEGVGNVPICPECFFKCSH